jgi:hypothetical protein
MKAYMFAEHLFQVLTNANDSRVERVEPCDVDGQTGIRVVGTDGVSIELSIVNASPPGGAAVEARNIVKEGAVPRPPITGYERWQHPKVRGDATLEE